MKKYAEPYAEWIKLGNGNIQTGNPLADVLSTSNKTDNDLPWDWVMAGQDVTKRGER